MSTSVLADGTEVRTSPATARPLLLGGLASLSAGAAAIHFVVTFEHFSEYSLYGVFFLVLAWAQLVWPVVLIALPSLTWTPARARPARFPAGGWSRSGLTPLAARRLAVWLWLAVIGNTGVLVIYFASRSVGLPFGPDSKTTEGWGGLDLVCSVEEIALVLLAAAIVTRPGLLARPVRFASAGRSLAGVLAAPVVVIAASAAVMTPAWAGPEGPSGMASQMASSSASSSHSSGSAAGSANTLQGGMGDMGTTGGKPDMVMAGNTNPPTAAQVQAAAKLIKATDATLVKYENVNAAIAAGYTERLATNGEEHLLYNRPGTAWSGLDPQDPSALVYAINVKGHAPILLGAMYMMPKGQNGPQIGGGLTQWHTHLEVCQAGQVTIAGFNVTTGPCNPSTWQDRYTTQMLHVWVVPYPGGVFSDDLSRAATAAAAQAALAQTKPGQLTP